jgi:hypothetical protein
MFCSKSVIREEQNLPGTEGDKEVGEGDKVAK